jgi:serine/threonine protein kinase
MTTSVTDRIRTAIGGIYRLEREVGRGGMATVYLAEDVKHHRKVALKVLHPELAAVVGADRFLREIEIAARLNNPHILPLHDSGHADGLLYYVMPFVEGESLRDRLTRERQLPVGDALRIAGEIAAAQVDPLIRRGGFSTARRRRLRHGLGAILPPFRPAWPVRRQARGLPAAPPIGLRAPPTDRSASPSRRDEA